ncbi:MAG: flagellar protein FlgN [Acidimicrobiales bacterium]
MPSSAVSERLSTLSQTLWRQRALVETLLYRLELQQMVLASGRTRWIDLSARDVENAIDDVRAEELMRATSVAAAAPLLNLPETASLSDLAEAAGDPWDQILRDHQSAFLSLIASVEDVSRDNREMLHHGLSETQDFLSRVTDVPRGLDGYSVEGTGTKAVAKPTLVDWDV